MRVRGSPASSMIAQQQYERRQLLARVAELEKENQKLTNDLMGYQVDDGYEKGHDDGEAGAVKVLTDPAHCDRYLRSRHCTLWGESFEIISPAGRAEAAAWLAAQVAGMAGPQYQ